MYRLFFIIFFIFISHVACATSYTLAVVEDGKTAEQNKSYWKGELAALSKGLNANVQLKVFSSYADELKELKTNPDKISFVYAKDVFIPEMLKLKHWQLIGKAIVIDPESFRKSMTYDAYILTNINSPINNISQLNHKKIAYYNKESTSNYIAMKKLLADKHIKDVTWIKANNINDLFNMIANGNADATSVWSYLFKTNSNASKYKIISRITNLTNPEIYMNTLVIPASSVQRIKQQLLKIEHGHSDVIGYQ